MLNCETCNIEHNGLYASGRFCSKRCASSFSTKFNREETNQKVSNTLKGKYKGKRTTNVKPYTHVPYHREEFAAKIKLGHSKRFSLFSFDAAPETEKRRRILREQNGNVINVALLLGWDIL